MIGGEIINYNDTDIIYVSKKKLVTSKADTLQIIKIDDTDFNLYQIHKNYLKYDYSLKRVNKEFWMQSNKYDFSKFITSDYAQALNEIRQGSKTDH
jgi:hypothetical protein